MITSMIGTNAASTSMSCALSTRNAGLNRPSEKIAAIEIAHQNGAPSSARSLRRIGNHPRSSAYRFRRFLDADEQHPNRCKPGQQRNPSHQSEIVAAERHQNNGHNRTDD